MCIETIEPNLPQFTLLKLCKGDIQILSHNKRPILTTDYDSLIQYASMRAKMNPTSTYTISRITKAMEL